MTGAKGKMNTDVGAWAATHLELEPLLIAGVFARDRERPQ
jgi:hypothetical protein